MGFCVAGTINGCGGGRVWPSSVTWPSCIASSSADCVLGGRAVDLITEDDLSKDRPLAAEVNLLAGSRM